MREGDGLETLGSMWGISSRYIGRLEGHQAVLMHGRILTDDSVAAVVRTGFGSKIHRCQTR